MAVPVPPSRGVRRSRTGAVLGGVCAGTARSAGLDPLLLRIAVVAVTVLTGGAGLVAYLAAWVLVPAEAPVLPTAPDGPRPAGPETAAPADGTVGGVGPTAAGHDAGTDLRGAWTAVGHELRTLATELRRPAPDPAPGPAAATADAADETDATRPAGGIPSPRSPVTAADDAATALGERLRAPEVQAGARRAAASATDALTASVDELGRRLHRGRG